MKHCHLADKLLEWDSSSLLKIYHLYVIYHTEKASVHYKKQSSSILLQSQLDQLRTLSTAPGETAGPLAGKDFMAVLSIADLSQVA